MTRPTLSIHSPMPARFARQRTGQAPTPLRMPRGWGYDIRDAAILLALLWGALRLLGVV